MHKVVLDGISDNMSATIHNGKYGVINTADTTTMGYYVTNYLSEPYTLQDNKIVDKQVIKSGEFIVKAEYLSISKASTNWHWQQFGTKESVIIETHNTVHPCLDVSTIKYDADIPISLWNKKQAQKSVQRHPICISDADHDYNLDEIEHRDQIDYKNYTMGNNINKIFQSSWNNIYYASKYINR